MATAAVEAPTVANFTEKANCFLYVAVPVSMPGQEEPPKTEGKPVFVLNSTDFINLQKYLVNAIKLPSSKAMFETTYPKSALDEFIKKDPSLYEALSIQLPEIHMHCRDFQSNTVGPMISLGGYISNFAGEATTYTQKITEGLKIIAAPGSQLSDPQVKAAVSSTRQILRKLKDYASDTKEECQKLVIKLSEFKTLTTRDKQTIDELNKRFDAAVPPESERNSVIQEILRKTQEHIKGLQAAQEKAYQDVCEAGGDKWYYYIPIVGAIAVIVNYIRFKGFKEAMENLKKEYNDAVEAGHIQEAQTYTAFAQVSGLSNVVDGVADTIEAAITSVNNMMTAFSNLETDFDSLRRKLSHVEGDIDEDYVEDRLVAFDDLKQAAETWAKVHQLAKAFQDHGMILDFSEHPEEKGQ